jgi:protein phosphatase-4 regulatory subunit 3
MTSFTRLTILLFYFTADDPAAAGSSSPVIGPNESITTASIIRSGHLPTPRLGIIGEIEKAIKALARTQTVKERICEYIQQEVSIISDVILCRD